MPRPTNKNDLAKASTQRFDELNGLIDSLPRGQQEQDFKPGTMNRNIRDVLGHVHHWHLLFLDWYAVGMKGGKPHMPAEGYSWARTTELNRSIHALYGDIPLYTMRSLLAASHAQVHGIIEQHSDQELFTKKLFLWTGSTSMGAYLVSATSSHYEWAVRLIKKASVN